MENGSEANRADTSPSRTDVARKSRNRKILWTVLGTIVALILIVAVAIGYVINSITREIETVTVDFKGQSSYSQNQTPEQKSSVEKPSSTTNILVLGSDSRISAGDPSQWKVGAQRTDAIMLVQLNPAQKTVNIVSIPRDSWVTIEGYGPAKINAAYSFGGPSLAVKTVNQLTGVRIDHFMIADFTSFKTMTDELGGVTITTSDGPVTMNGSQALTFVRERKHLPNGDFDRVRRQQAWMRAIMSKIMTGDALSSPTKLLSLVQTGTKNSAMDSGLTVPTLMGLATEMRGTSPSKVRFLTAPVAGVGRSAGGQSIVNLDYDQFSPLMKAFAEGTVEQYLEAHPDAKKYLLGKRVR